MKHIKTYSTIENKKANYDYYIEETLECGIALRGNEIKSIKVGMGSIKESWVDIVGNELVIKKFHVTAYDKANSFDVDENRDKKLLAHKKEIRQLNNKIKQDGYTLVPIKVYIKEGKCKVLIGLAKGKHSYDKRETEKKRQIERDMQRSM